MGSKDHLGAGLDLLRRGQPDRAVRELELALENAPSSTDAREYLLEAYRCRNAAYWLLSGYWRWCAGKHASWFQLPLFAGFVLLAVAAECAGGFEFLGALPRVYETNLTAEVAQVIAWCGVLAFVATREHKCVWVIERVTTVCLVPASVRARCLDETATAESRRALGYAFGALAIIGVAVFAAVASRWTDRVDGFALGALGLALPFGLAATLPRTRARNLVLLVLVVMAASALFAREPGELGYCARLTFFSGIVLGTPLLIVLHARAARHRGTVDARAAVRSDDSVTS